MVCESKLWWHTCLIRYTLTPTPPGLRLTRQHCLLTVHQQLLGTTTVTYTAADATGASASLTFTIEVTEFNNLDVDSDGEVTILDLVLVALNFGKIVDS